MVELVRAGRSPDDLAKEFEPTAQSIRNWVAQVERDTGRRLDGLTSEERQELARLRRENRVLREEREASSFRTSSKSTSSAMRWPHPARSLKTRLGSAQTGWCGTSWRRSSATLAR
jgi:transposase-like protein